MFIKDSVLFTNFQRIQSTIPNVPYITYISKRKMYCTMLLLLLQLDICFSSIVCWLKATNDRLHWPVGHIVLSCICLLPAKCQQCGHNLISPFDWLWMDGFSTWLGGSLYSPIFRRSIHQVHLHRFPRLIGLRARHQMHHSNAAATIAYTSDRPKFWAYYSSFEYVLPEKMLLKPLTK